MEFSKGSTVGKLQCRNLYKAPIETVAKNYDTVVTLVSFRAEPPEIPEVCRKGKTKKFNSGDSGATTEENT
uniref:MSP domain-containing protein n=1 Tax=Ascaris lumbricoides TaxID=6252 RepID=A0A0M3HNP3_ASCLU